LNKRNRTLTFVVLVVVLGTWTFVYFYPWPDVPYNSAAPKNIASEAPLYVSLTLEITSAQSAIATFRNTGRSTVTLYDNVQCSAFALIIASPDGASERRAPGSAAGGVQDIVKVELLPGAAYSRPLPITGLLPQNAALVSAAYQPGDILPAYRLSREIISNALPWPRKNREPSERKDAAHERLFQ